MDFIEINSLRVGTQVGIYPEKKGKIQELVITIYLRVSKKGGETDCLDDTINYGTIVKDVISHVENKKYILIETVATDVARICVMRHGAPWVKVMVQKPKALAFTAHSGVTIERCLEDFDWNEVHVSISSNINPYQNIRKALEMLKEEVQVTQVSRAFKTTPAGFKEQGDFVNIAVLLKSRMEPTGLKKFLTDIERQIGRIQDTSNSTGPVKIDLDISFWGSSVFEYKMERESKIHTCSIPDPDMLKYAHLIIPLADVTPDFIHPLQNKSLKMIAKEVTGVEDFHSFFPIVQISETKNIHKSNRMVLVGGENVPELSTSENIHSESSSEVKPNESSSDSLSMAAAVVMPIESEYPVSLVTGAAKRIGASIARQLHAAGYNVMIHYNTSKVEATALLQELNSLRSNSARLVQADLAVNAQKTSERIVKECLEAWGRLDVLVNNASQIYPTELGDVSEKEWNVMLQANLSSPFFLSQAAFPSLKSSHGCIINLTDIHADRPLANHSVYCISKAGLHMCTLSLAKEFAPHVRVNAVAPGKIPSETETVSEHKLKRIAMGRVGKPSDIACVVVFLAQRAGYVTGQVIRVDGGRSLNQ